VASEKRGENRGGSIKENVLVRAKEKEKGLRLPRKSSERMGQGEHIITKDRELGLRGGRSKDQIKAKFLISPPLLGPQERKQKIMSLR